MNKEVHLDIEVLRQILRDYKDFFLPVGVLLISVLLVVFFVMPQINGLLDQQNQLKIEKDKLSVLENNLGVINGLNESELDKQVNAVSSALPPQKSFAAILSAISNSASASNVELGDFEFQVGDISKPPEANTGFPQLKVSLSLRTDVESFVSFLEELKKNVPISEVLNAKSSANFSSVDVIFYYKPFVPSDFTKPTPIKSLSSADISIINSIPAAAQLPVLSPTPLPAPL